MTQLLNRQRALQLLGAVMGVFVKQPDASAQGLTSSGLPVLTINAKSSLSFNVDGFTEYRFIFNGETVIVTPAELFAALKTTP